MGAGEFGMQAVETLRRYAEASTLVVPKHAIERAVQSLPKIEALALVRASFGDGEAYASLDEAKVIYAAILGCDR